MLSTCNVTACVTYGELTSVPTGWFLGSKPLSLIQCVSHFYVIYLTEVDSPVEVIKFQ